MMQNESIISGVATKTYCHFFSMRRRSRKEGAYGGLSAEKPASPTVPEKSPARGAPSSPSMREGAGGSCEGRARTLASDMSGLCAARSPDMSEASVRDRKSTRLNSSHQ